MIRLAKIILVVFVGLQGLIYFAANIANWEAAYGAVAVTLAMADRPYYPNALGPAITNPALISLTLIVILAGEFLVGALSLKGALDMTGKLSAPAADFNASKKFAIMGGAMALIVWFGFFTVIAGAFFQMWQVDLGRLSLADAHGYLVPSALVLFFTAMNDD